MRHRLILLSLLLLQTWGMTALAQDLPAITLNVDAPDAPRNVLRARLVIPVKTGPLTLFYPKWIPGEHTPTGPINDIVGLRLSGGGKTIPWRRDDVEMFAFHCDVPAGVNGVEVAFDDVSQPRTTMTARLVYNEAPNGQIKINEQLRKQIDLSYSIGLIVKDDGQVLDANPEMTAARAGLAPGMKLIAVNGRRWSPEILQDAIKATKTSAGRLELLAENGSFNQTYNLDYQGGERYPHLERDRAKPDLLSEVIKPRGALAPSQTR